MDLLKMVSGAVGADDLSKLAGQFGLGSDSINKVMEQVVPALGQGLKNTAGAPGGLDSLAGALQTGDHQRYLGNPEEASGQAGIATGNGILGHVFGSKDVSRKVADQAASASGVSPDVIKKMLPMIATLAMGALSKQTDGGAKLQGLAGGENAQGLLGSLLGSDGDGSSMGDVLKLAGKFF